MDICKKNYSNRRRKNCEGAKASNFYKSKDKNLFTQLLPITQPTALEPLLQGWLISASSRTFMTHWDAVLSKLLVVWSIGLKIRPLNKNIGVMKETRLKIRPLNRNIGVTKETRLKIRPLNRNIGVKERTKQKIRPLNRNIGDMKRIRPGNSSVMNGTQILQSERGRGSVGVGEGGGVGAVGKRRGGGAA